MLSAKLWYARNGAWMVTHLPFSYSCVGSDWLPAGPVPLIPNRLWPLTASSLWPQPDSSMACAMVTAAGTPYRRCVAIAPGATSSMNPCRVLVVGADAAPGAVAGAAVCLGCDAVGVPAVLPPGRPGIAAVLAALGVDPALLAGLGVDPAGLDGLAVGPGGAAGH